MSFSSYLPNNQHLPVIGNFMENVNSSTPDLKQETGSSLFHHQITYDMQPNSQQFTDLSQQHLNMNLSYQNNFPYNQPSNPANLFYQNNTYNIYNNASYTNYPSGIYQANQTLAQNLTGKKDEQCIH